MTVKNAGIIGLGAMGYQMARHMVNKGFPVAGYDVTPEANARATGRKQALEAMPRYLELEVALEKDPANRALKREFEKVAEYHEFLLRDAERIQRRTARRLARLGLDAPGHRNSCYRHRCRSQWCGPPCSCDSSNFRPPPFRPPDFRDR